MGLLVDLANKNQPPDAAQTRTGTAARREAAQAELRRVQARQRRGRLLFAGGVVAVVVAIIATVVIYGLQRNNASGEKTTAAAVSGSNRPLRAVRTCGSPMASDSASFLARPALNGAGPRAMSPDESVTGILSHRSSGYRARLLTPRAATLRPAFRMKPMILATAS